MTQIADLRKAMREFEALPTYAKTGALRAVVDALLNVIETQDAAIRALEKRVDDHGSGCCLSSVLDP